MPIKDQCAKCKLNNSEGCPQGNLTMFDGISCDGFSRKEIDLEKNETPITQPVQPNNLGTSTAIPTPTSSTAERISGWLTLFLISINIGAVQVLFTTLGEIGTYYNSELDVLFSLMLLALAVFATIRFVKRKPDAVFLGKAYIIICAFGNLFPLIAFAIVSDEKVIFQIVRSLVLCIIWFLYLTNSKQVKRLFPKSTRQLKGYDYWIVIAVVIQQLLPLLSML